MTGYWSPIHMQPTHVREAILKSWTTARLQSLQSLAKAVTLMAQKSNCLTNPYLDRLNGYTDVPHDWKAVEGYKYDFIQLAAGDEPHVLTTDVVIVGSGYGGAVSAKNLAEAGHRVLVLDKGYHFPPAHLPLTQRNGNHYLFDHHGPYMTEKAGGTSIIAGGAWGGGGTVNWSVCLKLQDQVRNEWAEAGLPFFASDDFDESTSRVWDFVGASTENIRHNHRNEALLRGCEKLGWKAAVAPQNTAGQDHWCGQCHLGCGSSGKRGPTVSWLPAAADAGAQFMEGFEAQKVLFDEDGVTATGVEGVWTSRGPNGEVHTSESERSQRRVTVKARKVVIAAGSLWSPVVLMNSNIKVRNQHIATSALPLWIRLTLLRTHT
jgi:choline dehydrogenase-like flavoprotein